MTPRRTALALALILAGTALTLTLMGRPLICTCGWVELWHGANDDAGNSQHLIDWYTPSHVLHGLIFYAVLARFAPRWTLGARLTAATLVEAAWELAENSPAIIDRYRAATIALGYEGDAVVNSLADIGAMWLGFALARVLPVWASVALFLTAEAVTVALIRDGLILNVLMLLWPLEAVRAWQAGG